MRVIGIDPSSTFCGASIVDSPDSIQAVMHWERDKNKSHPDGFKSYFWWLGGVILKYNPHVAVVEMGAYIVSQGRGAGKGNFQAIQAVSFYQAISVLSCKLNGLVVVESRASSARKAVLGNGGLAKDKVWEIMCERFPDLFAPKTRGGLDECDATVLAMSGPRAMER